MPETLEPIVLAAIASGLFTLIGVVIGVWWNRRKIAAEASKANADAEASKTQAMRNLADAAKISGDQLADRLRMIDVLSETVERLETQRKEDRARNDELVTMVDALRNQQATNMATIAALNAQNASTLKMNNDLLLENRLLQQRVGQLESELSVERNAKMLLERKVKDLEARIAELEARNPA